MKINFWRGDFGGACSVHLSRLDSTKFQHIDVDLGIFLDLAKAFESLDRSVLLKKHEFYNIGPNVIKCFESYFANRRKRAKYGNIFSSISTISYGVPQGSNKGHFSS